MLPAIHYFHDPEKIIQMAIRKIVFNKLLVHPVLHQTAEIFFHIEHSFQTFARLWN